MTTFRTLVQRGEYAPDITGQEPSSEPRLVVPLRGDEIGQVTSIDVLGRFGDAPVKRTSTQKVPEACWKFLEASRNLAEASWDPPEASRHLSEAARNLP